MINNLYIRKTLSDDHLSQIKEHMPHLTWVDGKNTSTVNSKVNEQAVSEGDDYTKIDKIVVDSLCSDKNYEYYYCPKSTTYSILSKTSVGGKYPLHSDSSHLGHYSTTTFLNEPDEYEGGELHLHINGKIEEIKLPAGYSVTYITGTPHEVRPVVSGTRLVAVNWTASEFNSIDQRDIYGDLLRCVDIVEADKTGEVTCDSPSFILNEVVQKFKRLYL